jgi:hypothetical protein
MRRAWTRYAEIVRDGASRENIDRVSCPPDSTNGNVLTIEPYGAIIEQAIREEGNAITMDAQPGLKVGRAERGYRRAKGTI